MRVHHIPRRFVEEEWGGTETAVLNAAKGLQERGHQTKILTSSALSRAGKDEIQGVPVHRFSYFYPYLGLSAEAENQLDLRGGNLFSPSLLTHLMLQPPPDVFHLHTGKRLGGIVRTAAKYHRRPYVVSLHGGVCDVPAAEQERWIQPTEGTLEWGQFLGAVVGARRVLEDADAILCVNKNEQATLQKKYPGKRIVWSPNSIHLAHYRSGDRGGFRAAHRIPPSSKVILSVGRIDPQKNQLQTIEVFDQLTEFFPDLHLVLAGAETDPKYGRTVRERIARSQSAERIHNLGSLRSDSRELVDAYHAADVFLLSSIHEPFGIVLLEAWAAGLPIVSSAVGGVVSFVEPTLNGLLYQSEDSQAAIACVRTLLESHEWAQAIRDNARLAVRQFDAGSSIDSLVALYEEVAREHSLCA